MGDSNILTCSGDKYKWYTLQPCGHSFNPRNDYLKLVYVKNNNGSIPHVRTITGFLETTAVKDTGIQIVSFSQDLAFCATSFNGSRCIKTWDVVSRAAIDEYPGHSGPVSALFVTDDGVVISGSRDRTVVIWDRATRAKVHVLHTGDIPTSIHVNPTRDVLKVVLMNGIFIEWNLDRATGQWAYKSSHVMFPEVYLHDTSNCYHRVFDSKARDDFLHFHSYNDRYMDRWTPDEKYLVHMRFDQKTNDHPYKNDLSISTESMLWDMEANRCLASLQQPERMVHSVARASSGLIALGMGDGFIGFYRHDGITISLVDSIRVFNNDPRVEGAILDDIWHYGTHADGEVNSVVLVSFIPDKSWEDLGYHVDGGLPNINRECVLAVSNYGACFIFLENDHIMRVWELPNPFDYFPYDTWSWINHVRSLNATVISQYDTMYMHDLTTFTRTRPVIGIVHLDNEIITSICSSNNGEITFIGTHTGKIGFVSKNDFIAGKERDDQIHEQFYSVKERLQELVFTDLVEAHDAEIVGVDYNAEMGLLACASLDASISVWNVRASPLASSRSPEKIATLLCNEGTCSSVRFSPGGSFLAAGTTSGHIFTWTTLNDSKLNSLVPPIVQETNTAPFHKWQERDIALPPQEIRAIIDLETVLH
nr:WD40 repeat domain-containing protein [Candidatus Sigynarchaeota archaeon]